MALDSVEWQIASLKRSRSLRSQVRAAKFRHLFAQKFRILFSLNLIWWRTRAHVQ